MESTITKKGATVKQESVTKTQSKPKTSKASSGKKQPAKQPAKASASKPAKKSAAAGVATAKISLQPVTCSDYAAENPEQKEVAIVVGGSSGIGYHTALALCKEGFKVYNISRTDAEPQFIQNVHADVCDAAEVAEAIETVFAREGRIDTLIYSAGWSLACPLEHVTENDFRKVFEVNYFGLIKVLWAVIPIMRAQGGGRIVAVSSLAGTTPIPFDAAYSASKAAIDITLRSLAIELFPYNIKVTSVQPGGVHTRFTYKRKVYPEELIGTYHEAMQKAVAKLDQAEQNGMDPRGVASFIAGLLTEKNPPQITAIGLKDRAAKAVSKLLPVALTDYLNRIAWN